MFTRRAALTLPLAALATRAGAADIDLRLPGGPSLRPLTRAFPGKGEMILQRLVPPLLETPLAAFDTGVITPNDRFFVRWHWPVPTEIDPATWRLAVGGAVTTPLQLSLAELAKLPQQEVVAVNQCAGNARGLFEPRVAGAQWGQGAWGNARWRGVALKHVLDRAGVAAGAMVVRFAGADTPPVEGAPQFRKALAVDHARDGEVLVATHMNGEPLPLLNGAPLRLVVPGWYSTYWVKALNHIELLPGADDNFWMAKAYLIPDTPGAHVAPGTKDFPKKPIAAMVPRALITSLTDGDRAPVAERLTLRGIAMGGDQGVAKVEISTDAGATWRNATLGVDIGRYSFRRFEAAIAPVRGPMTILTRATNSAGATQPLAPIWNPSGYQRGQVEATRVEFV
ncbi:oxidase [alpha proteobacterium AAP81b]|nr:oxidase [alpha proteobacterium AAP81b]